MKLLLLIGNGFTLMIDVLVGAGSLLRLPTSDVAAHLPVRLGDGKGLRQQARRRAMFVKKASDGIACGACAALVPVLIITWSPLQIL